MTVLGSDLTNTSDRGQPGDSEDRAFSYALGTQIFINPVDTPTDAVVEFRVNVDLLNGTNPASKANLAIGLGADSQLSEIGSWTSTTVRTPTSTLFPVCFTRSDTQGKSCRVVVEGTECLSLSRSQDVSGVDVANNVFTITGHTFSNGDRVAISSSAELPGGLSELTRYFISNATANTFTLALNQADALNGSSLAVSSSGDGNISVVSDELFTLTRFGSTGSVQLKRSESVIATFSLTNSVTPLRLFYWCREMSASLQDPLVKSVKVRGAI